jgi:hypothetical protein
MGLTAALELTAHRFVLVDEKDQDVEVGLGETGGVGRPAELLAEVVETGEQVLEALHLHHGAREAVHHGAADVLGLEQLAEQQLDHLAVTDEHPGVDALAGLGTGEKVADDDRLRVVIAILQDELGVRPLARAGRSVQPEDLPGEGQFGTAELTLQSGPDGVEDDLAVLDLQVAHSVAGGSGLRFVHAGQRGER